jgi:hypothetical protein
VHRRIETFFSEADREAIRAATATAERRTTGEIVVYVTERCDAYPEAAWKAALIGGAVGVLCGAAARWRFGGWGSPDYPWILIGLQIPARLRRKPLRRCGTPFGRRSIAPQPRRRSRRAGVPRGACLCDPGTYWHSHLRRTVRASRPGASRRGHQPSCRRPCVERDLQRPGISDWSRSASGGDNSRRGALRRAPDRAWRRRPGYRERVAR